MASDHIVIIGGGAFGCALAWSFIHQRNLRVVLAARRPHALYKPELAQHSLCEVIALSELDASLLSQASCVILAIPCQSLRTVCTDLADKFAGASFLKEAFWINTAKGIEEHTLLLPHQILESLFPKATIASLSGPSFAAELFKGLPTCMVLAGPEYAKDSLSSFAHLLHTANLRIYTSFDIVGVEFGGALKNVVAIMAGIAEGLGLGYNSMAALLTRGLWEISKIAHFFGAQTQTLMGLAGVGDLILTCHGPLSRNKQYGLSLAQGSCSASGPHVPGVVEGVVTARSVHALLQKHPELEAPLFSYAYKVLYEHFDIQNALSEILHREQKMEFGSAPSVHNQSE